MICKKCGTENYENAKFCRECGRPLIIIETKKKQRPISVKVCVDIIIIVVVCGAMLFAAFFYQHKDNLYVKISDNSIVEELKPDYIKVAEKYAKAEARNDLNGVIEVLPIEPMGTWGELIKQLLLSEYEDDSEGKYEIVDQDVICNVIDVEDRSGEELMDLQNQYIESWGTTISNDKKIKMKVRYAGSTEENVLDVWLIEMQEKWYIDIENIKQMTIE